MSETLSKGFFYRVIVLLSSLTFVNNKFMFFQQGYSFQFFVIGITVNPNFVTDYVTGFKVVVLKTKVSTRFILPVI